MDEISLFSAVFCPVFSAPKVCGKSFVFLDGWPGAYSVKIKELFAVSILAWASLPLNGIFNPEDGFVGCDRQEKF
ncbi:hypothetical protein [Dysosmobacter sp.]|uniref:hypothetical protein n=1 Tax=Dysosmobacter sp. TaxID=2591382 RepID=UPI002670D618|nr:hypothetical protein [Dysosmobacter sp.]MCI7281853.1 hypothetical protein [Dysosmobacter sp.]